jgi:hypothetical protein
MKGEVIKRQKGLLFFGLIFQNLIRIFTSGKSHIKQALHVYMVYAKLEEFFAHGATAPSGSGPHYRGFTIILRHTTLNRIPLDQ